MTWLRLLPKRQCLYFGSKVNVRSFSQVESMINTIEDAVELPVETAEALMEALPQTFHEISGGGFNGALSKAFLSKYRTKRILNWENAMKEHSEEPTSTLTYNYLLYGHLSADDIKGSFDLIKAMENKGLKPDLFTFELILERLAGKADMAVTVDELFDLMQQKYGMSPSANCWRARMRVWLCKKEQDRAMIVFDEMVEKYPHFLSDGKLLSDLLGCAIRFSQWRATKKFLTFVKPTIPIETLANFDWPMGSDKNSVIIPSSGYLALIYSRIEYMTLDAVTLMRLCLHQTPHERLDEGSYRHLLYYCARMGSGLNDLALHALKRLISLYNPSSVERPRLPRFYLEAFSECVSKDTTTVVGRPVPFAIAPLSGEVVRVGNVINGLLGKKPIVVRALKFTDMQIPEIQFPKYKPPTYEEGFLNELFE